MTTNRLIRHAYRKRLLPHVEQCLLGRARPVATHHAREQLDYQTASEILACFEGHTWLTGHHTPELMEHWEAFIRSGLHCQSQITIGKFVEHLYSEQVAYDQNVQDGPDELKPTVGEQHERRLALLATLYIAGFLADFQPESLAEIS